MYCKIWGVRGSLPVPGASTLKYGGNTTCIQVNGHNDECIVLDAGTGIFPLGQHLANTEIKKIHLFITHTHWDHIQGFTMFQPLFSKDVEINIYGPKDPTSGLTIRDHLTKQMDRHFFPVQLKNVPACLNFKDVTGGQRIKINSLIVKTFEFNHTAVNIGYRISSESRSIIFTGDHEWKLNPHSPGDVRYLSMEQSINSTRQKTIEFIKEADLLIIDSAYTEEEYLTRHGWGHGTLDSSISAAREARAKQVLFTHHDPRRTDIALERIFKDSIKRNSIRSEDPEFSLAKEGMEIKL
ncbi:MAG: MBL fold metallo-hydrolase [Porticoccaceae bacterium]|nr:MBL fold metallo-hydrolase [Porticoccaceae bacterium]